MEKPHNYFQPNCREQHGAGLACVETAPKEAFIDCVECPSLTVVQLLPSSAMLFLSHVPGSVEFHCFQTEE